MNIRHSTTEDINYIFRLYRNASAYQRTKFLGNVWPEFERTMVLREIEEHRQFKLMVDGTIACIWAVTFNDPEIWGEKDAVPSIYIHRIATDPEFRGNNFMAHLVAWAKPYALAKGMNFIRLDTCGHNQGLITHYTKNGFDFLGMIKMKDTVALPSHYHNAEVCLFEMALSS